MHGGSPAQGQGRPRLPRYLAPCLREALANRIAAGGCPAPAGKRFVAGVVLCDGSAGIAFGDGLFVVRVRKLWETA